MAIKEKKLPTPSEVKTSPQRFTDEELNEIKELRKELNELTIHMGSLFINKIKLEEAEDILKKSLKEVEGKEANLAKKLSTKYGKGSIDVETGTFTPVQ